MAIRETASSRPHPRQSLPTRSGAKGERMGIAGWPGQSNGISVLKIEAGVVWWATHGLEFELAIPLRTDFAHQRPPFFAFQGEDVSFDGIFSREVIRLFAL